MPVQAYLTNGQQLVYDNDVNGSRVRNTVSGSSDNFYFNGADGKTEAVSLVAHGSNLIYNVLGAGGDNIGQVKVVSASPTRYYYLKDHLGSIKVTVDASGNAVGWDDYYPYGAQMNLRCQTASADGRYKFTGKERDASTGLDYFGARYYDSWTGMWRQVDPLKEKYHGVSPYCYTLDNPIIFFDPDGKKVVFAQGTSQQFKKEFAQAVKYLNTHKEGKFIAALEKSKAVYTIDYKHQDDRFTPSSKTIYWDPNAGFRTDKLHELSATTLLNHEADHAADFDKNPTQHIINSSIPVPKYDYLEEERVITGSEQETAKALGEIKDGEVTREEHNLGSYYTTPSPISTEDVNAIIVTPKKEEIKK
jgi:RHS repeat-associated protein